MYSGQNCALKVKYKFRNIKIFGALHIFYAEEIPVLVVLLYARDKFRRIPPAFYGNRRFTTAVTSARHLSLSWAGSIKSTPPHPTSWSSILILSSHLSLDRNIPSTKSHVPFSLFRLHQSISPGPRLCLWIFRNKIRFNKKFFVPRPTPKLQDHPL